MDNKKKDKDILSEALRENLKRRKTQSKDRIKINLAKQIDKNTKQDLDNVEKLMKKDSLIKKYT